MADNMNSELNISAQEMAKQANYEKRLAEKRKKREALSSIGLDDPFAIPQDLLDPRFQYVIVNDKGNSLSTKQAMGYEFVEDSRIATAMGLTEKGVIKFSTGMSDPKWAFLMRIEKELYKEDQDRINERAIKQYKQLEAAPDGLKFSKNANVSDLPLDKSETVETK